MKYYSFNGNRNKTETLVRGKNKNDCSKYEKINNCYRKNT